MAHVITKAPLGGEDTGAFVDRRKMGTKRSVLTDQRGAPLAVEVTGANTHDTGRGVLVPPSSQEGGQGVGPTTRPKVPTTSVKWLERFDMWRLSCPITKLFCGHLRILL